MCLIVLSLNEHPDYPLIVAANRDEFYERKSASAAFWSDHPEILGGRDLVANGTWLAMHRNGRVAMVTNYRDLTRYRPDAPSRGGLVTDFLLSEQQPLAYLEDVARRSHLYNGFNLIVGNPHELYYYSNYGNGITAIPPGLHGISNALLNTPWPKVRKATQTIGTLIRDRVGNPDTYLDALYDDVTAPDNELPDTGVGLERERQLSSVFIKSPGYGSRSSTVILVDRNNQVRFSERVYNPADFSYSRQAFTFRVGSGAVPRIS
ncbi:MAG TPA: NRDE family protein [Cyclobacteriaceae bacterium]|jgi:uncharacterized protein with NRDE domain